MGEAVTHVLMAVGISCLLVQAAAGAAADARGDQPPASASQGGKTAPPGTPRTCKRWTHAFVNGRPYEDCVEWGG